jgi:hypothetical protein
VLCAALLRAPRIAEKRNREVNKFWKLSSSCVVLFSLAGAFAGCASNDGRESDLGQQSEALSCATYRQYVTNTTYATGDIVQNAGNAYKCTASYPNSLHCGQAGYEPGTSIYWNLVWAQLGACDATASCGSPTAPPVDDAGYRVIVQNAKSANGEDTLPSPTSNWTIKYQYVVPPLPCAPTWNYTNGVFYIWGDVDFDEYGSNGGYPLSNYMFNQIVPQLMIGRALAGNDANYNPSWTNFSGWVIQAQYFWQDNTQKFWAKTGPAVNVKPGDVVTTAIAYNATNGSISVNISTPSVSSAISLPKPFPNQNLFTSWKDFFQKGVAKSGGKLLSRPVMNVETYGLDQATACSVLPWNVNSISLPGITQAQSSYSVSQYGGLSCPTALAKLNF